MFFQMPVAASVTLLTKLQSDIRYAEGEVLNDLLKNVDIQDVRVNTIEAQVIPQSQIVVRGQNYVADIVASAIDTTQRPSIFVNGKQLPESSKGRISFGTGSTGTFPVRGYLELNTGSGTTIHREFSTQYTVIEPSATVAPVLMNVLYAGYNNDVQIAVPGFATQDITATMTNGSLTAKGNGIWVARPSAIGTDAIISVKAKMSDGRTMEMANKTFRVKRLPDPSIFLNIKDAQGNPEKFIGGSLSKAVLLATDEITVAIDDGILNVPFTVSRFEATSIDSRNYEVTEVSDGPRFTERQKTVFRGLARDKRLYIRSVVAKGPDGTERRLKVPLEIIIK
jgi:gliding motility-associated protein GldM